MAPYEPPPPHTGADDEPAPEAIPAIPAATVVVARDAFGGPEVLLLRRSSTLAFAGGMWVFPGGRVDDADRDLASTRAHTGAGARSAPDAHEASARIAAVREAGEEAGLSLDPESLVWFSHWTPPALSNKRFATWFFVAPAPADLDLVTIDGGEIHDHGWFPPADALARCNAREIDLSPPTWITLEYLRLFPSVAELLTHAASRPAEFFETHIGMADEAVVALYDGDAGYATSDPHAVGGRHRLWMDKAGWRYERDGWPDLLFP